jgi:hypothetical protein
MITWISAVIVKTEIPPILIGGAMSTLAMVIGSYVRPDSSHQSFLEQTNNKDQGEGAP